MEVSKFVDKLNKVDGNTYVVEEEVSLTGGVYEAELAHDNIDETTISVYSGPKLTGDRIETFTLSTPSLMPWKRIIRVYSGELVVYISYETVGDIVEADDVNQLQNSIVVTQEALNLESGRAQTAEEALMQEISAEKARASGKEAVLEENLNEEITRAQNRENSLETVIRAEEARAAAAERELKSDIQNHVAAVETELLALRQTDADLEEKKADAVSVNAALAERYTKSQVYTKEEVLAKIEELIGTAPNTLDTFQEIADALGNDPNFATTIMNILAGKVDKETGKGLSSNDYSDTDKAVLQDVSLKAHSHSNKAVLEAITQLCFDGWTDAYNKRHEHENKGILDAITQTLIDSWNTVTEKVDKTEGKGLSSNDFTNLLLEKLNGIAEKANNYVHPSTSGNRHIPSGGASGKILRWSSDGTAVWGDESKVTDAVLKGCTWNDLKGE